MLPAHLKRYIVEQDYSRYTPVDQEVWRYIMRQLRDFLSVHAHPCYAEGLERTGIEIDRIPEISKMSEKLEKFGWRAVPVSGFIPPAAFMELQAHGYLPIASDMRAIDHLMYTPAPDIVHEAAGHAPILVNEEYASYLKDYAQVARKAIISQDDMIVYDAIRVLSDLKEDPHSTPEQIKAAEKRLDEIGKAITEVSEAAYLSRMNWWTAEYGLIGTLENPRIFGAGLLSSVGEARNCLGPKVKKIPLTVDCINYSYDITEQQPQLFVTSDFNHLRVVLQQLADKMAFRTGGSSGLEKARVAKTVNTVELNSGLQISGSLKEFLKHGAEPAYLQFSGPTQLCFGGRELSGHGSTYHAQGFGSPIGRPRGAPNCLSETSETELAKLGLVKGRLVNLTYDTGAKVSGTVEAFTRAPNGRLLLVTFKDCTVTLQGRVLFEPAWGVFDMAVGSQVTSVFGGPADRAAYGETDDFVARVIPRKQWPELMKYKHSLYQELREARAKILSGEDRSPKLSSRLEALVLKFENDFPHDWLARLDLFELSRMVPSDSWRGRLEIELKNLADSDSLIGSQIRDGLRLIH